MTIRPIPKTLRARAYVDHLSARELSLAVRQHGPFEQALRAIAEAPADWTRDQLQAVARKALAR